MSDAKVSLADVRNLYKLGYSDVEIMSELNFTKAVFKDLCSASPAFQKVVEQGRVDAEAYWMKAGREALKGGPLNATVWQLTLKNRYGWSEKSENTEKLTDLSQKTTEELQKEASEYVSQKATMQ